MLVDYDEMANKWHANKTSENYKIINRKMILEEETW